MDEPQDPALTNHQPRQPSIGTPEFVTTLSNDFVNGNLIYEPQAMGTLCIRCGTTGHYSSSCQQLSLPLRERAVLRAIVQRQGPVFRRPSPAVGQDQNDNVQNVSSMTAMPDETNNVVKSIANVNLGEGETRKRMRTCIEEQATGEPNTQSEEAQSRNKAKGKKRVGKAASLAPIVGLVSEDRFLKQPKSVRQILFDTKPEMSLLDLIAWSPSICQEVKRLVTRLPSEKGKGRRKKAGPKKQIEPDPPSDSNDVVVGMYGGRNRHFGLNPFWVLFVTFCHWR